MASSPPRSRRRWPVGVATMRADGGARALPQRQVAGTAKAGHVAAGSGFVLLVLAAGQFLMTLDSSVMNVSIRQVAADVGTTVTGIQTAITLYTLVMASLMITGGKIGAIIGRRRAMSIGLVIYGAGSLTTALAPNLGVLLVGLVVPGGHRRRADHAGHRGPGRRQLPARAPARGLRDDRRGGRHRGGGRTAHRRGGDHVRVVALGLRRRSRDRDRHPRGAAQGRATRRPPAAPGST